MNPILSEILATRTVVEADGSVIPLHSEISLEEGARLQKLICEHKPQVTLEVGLAFGVSALFICEALAAVNGQKHIVIDPNQMGVRSADFVAVPSGPTRTAWNGVGLRNLERAGYGHLIEFHGLPSFRALPALESSNQRIDFAFIDGWHTFDYALVDFFYVDRLLRVGGILVLDDLGYPAVRRVARYVATNRAYTPLPDGASGPASARRRIFHVLSSTLRMPGVRQLSRHLIRPDVVEPDAALGLPTGNFVAFQKTSDDRLGDGWAGSRRWDQHHDF